MRLFAGSLAQEDEDAELETRTQGDAELPEDELPEVPAVDTSLQLFGRTNFYLHQGGYVFNRVCLKLVAGRDSDLTLCDSSEGFLVSSGSSLLQLDVGDSVSLQVTRFNNIVTSQSSTSHTFTGFLLFPTI